MAKPWFGSLLEPPAKRGCIGVGRECLGLFLLLPCVDWMSRVSWEELGQVKEDVLVDVWLDLAVFGR